MKLTYKHNGTKIVANVSGRLTKDGSVELTSLEALKLAAALLLKVDISQHGAATPVTLDREAEEMVAVEGFDVKANGGPSVGIRVTRIPADIERFVESVAAESDCVTVTAAPASATGSDGASAIVASAKKVSKGT